MKRVLAALLILVFVVGVVGVYSADAAVAKKVAKKVVKKAVKKAPVAPVPVVPPPPIVTPPPPPIKVAVAAPAGLLGMGLETAAEVGLVAGLMGLTGNVILPDPMGLGPMVGLSDKAVSFKLGLGYAQGKETATAGGTWKAVPIIVDGVISLPADAMGGIDTFIGGGLNYVVTRSGSAAGTIGGQVYVGAQGDLGLGLGGKTYGEVGYSILRSGLTAGKTSYSSKSVSVLVGQKIVL